MPTSRNVRSRLRRSALSPRLAGLVMFSFSLLGISAAGYAATVPSLVAISEHVGSGGRFQVVASGRLGAPDASEGPAGAQGGAGGAGGESDGGAPGSKSPLGGASLGAIKTPLGSLGDASDKGGAGDAGSGGASGGSSADGGASGSGGSSSGGSGGSSGSGGEPQVPETPQEPPVTDEEEQRVYEALYAKASLIDGYVSRINSATQAFNSDCLASQDLRRQRYAEVDGLMQATFGEYMAVRDGILVPNASRYKAAQDDLICMYRLLTEYCAILREAWGINKELADPAANVDLFMAPIRANEVNGVNQQLAEFQQAYGRFTL